MVLFIEPEQALAKVRAAEDAWNTRDPERVALAYTTDSVWRNRDEFITGRAEIVGFLTRKWAREQDYALRKELWGFRNNRIAVRFQYEWHDEAGQWWRSYGNELWEFADCGMSHAAASECRDEDRGVSVGGEGGSLRHHGAASECRDENCALMRRREASVNDRPIRAVDRRIFGPRSSGESDAVLPID